MVPKGGGGHNISPGARDHGQRHGADSDGVLLLEILLSQHWPYGKPITSLALDWPPGWTREEDDAEPPEAEATIYLPRCLAKGHTFGPVSPMH